MFEIIVVGEPRLPIGLIVLYRLSGTDMPQNHRTIWTMSYGMTFITLAQSMSATWYAFYVLSTLPRSHRAEGVNRKS